MSDEGSTNGFKKRFSSAVDHTKSQINRKTELIKKPITDKVDSIKANRADRKAFREELHNTQSFAGKAKLIGNRAKNKFEKTDAFKKYQDFIVKMQKVAAWVTAHAYPISVLSAIILLCYALIVFSISLVQSATPTPHYYCDTEAGSALKRTAVYQQYCNNGKGFELENLNGHYIVQDGSGPCVCCAMANMYMRYYALHDINFFDYLWNETGQYSMDGQSLFCYSSNKFGNLHTILNTWSNGTNTTAANSYTYGTQNFAKSLGQTHTTSNWGYLRDESLDIAVWDETDDYYVSNADNSNWVWDLSKKDREAGSTWILGNWGTSIVVDNIPCLVVCQANDVSITGETLKEIFADTSYCGEAGIVVYYDYDGDGKGNHAILVTGYDESTGYWSIIDSAKGVSGGYEGPADGSGNFVWNDEKVAELLNSGQNRNGNFAICTIAYCQNF